MAGARKSSQIVAPKRTRARTASGGSGMSPNATLPTNNTTMSATNPEPYECNRLSTNPTLLANTSAMCAFYPGYAPFATFIQQQRPAVALSTFVVDQQVLASAPVVRQDQFPDASSRPPLCQGLEQEASMPKPRELAKNAAQCRAVMERFANGDKSERRRIASWLLPSAHELALTSHGTRLCQEMLEEVTGPEQAKFLSDLEPHFNELYQDMHGNYLLSKVIEVFPSASLGSLIRPLVGRAVAVARHRFGCRIMERLVEHCSEAQLADILDEIVANVGVLCRHAFGNFIIQKMLEHCATQRTTIVIQMLPTISLLAMHRTASHVVQRTLDFCGDQSQEAVARAFLAAPAPYSLLDAAQNRYGSFVLEQLVKESAAATEVRQVLIQASEVLVHTVYGRRVLASCGVELPSDITATGA